MKSIIILVFLIASAYSTLYSFGPIADGWSSFYPAYLASGACYTCNFNGVSKTMTAVNPGIIEVGIEFQASVMFNISSLSGCTIKSANVTITANNTLNDGIVVTSERSSTTWSESAICPPTSPQYTCPGISVNINNYTPTSSCTINSAQTCTSSVTSFVETDQSTGLVSISFYTSQKALNLYFYARENGSGAANLVVLCD
jgi:hypothetical protein